MSTRVVDDAQATVDQRDIDDAAVGAENAVAEAAMAVRTAVFDGIVEDVEPWLGDALRVGRVQREVALGRRPDP